MFRKTCLVPAMNCSSTSPRILRTALRFIEDYEDYFVVMDFKSVNPPAGTAPNAIVTGARQVTPTVIATFTIDNFATGSDVVPGAGVASLTAAAALLTADPTAALHIEGFTDDVGDPANNLDLAQRRADNGKTIIGAALARRIAAIGRGETSFAVAQHKRIESRAQSPHRFNRPSPLGNRPQRPPQVYSRYTSGLQLDPHGKAGAFAGHSRHNCIGVLYNCSLSTYPHDFEDDANLLIPL